MTKQTQRVRRSLQEINADKATVQAARELEAKLQIVRYVNAAHLRWTWNQAREIREAVDAGTLKVHETHSNSPYTKGSALHDAHLWDNKETHSTYDGCHDFMLQWNANDVEGASVKYVIWDGENMRGERERVRVTFILTGDWRKVDFLCRALERRFETHCLDAYDEELERKRRAGAAAMGRAMIHAIANKHDVTVDEFEPDASEADE